MRILVTGGAGFIGSNFARYISEKSTAEIVVLDKLTYAGNLENIRDLIDSERILFVKGDVCNPDAVERAMKGCDAVVHFAAETHVDRSIAEAGTFVKTDVYGTFVMLETARSENVQRFIHISTDEVYGESKRRACRENSPLYPRSPYAASKAGADRLAYSYFSTFDLPVVITRSVNNYGPMQHPEKAIPLFTICAIANHPLPIYGSGKNRREWIHVEDHCRALLMLLREKGIEGQTFNIGTGERRSTLQVARAIVDALDKERSLIRSVKDRPGHVLSHSVNSEKLIQTTGWKPLYSFDQEIKRTVGWYEENAEWWRKILLGTARPYFENGHPDLLTALRM